MTLDEAIKRFEELTERWAKEGSLNQESFMPLDEFMRYHVECLERASECKQIVEWLRELKAYRGILANADRLIESEYGVVIIEGYKDVIDQMNEVYMEVNADES